MLKFLKARINMPLWACLADVLLGIVIGALIMWALS